MLWHPACALGEPLARRVHQWLRPGNGVGPEVFFRSLPAPGAPKAGLPPPLPGESRVGLPAGASGKPGVANFQIVLPLIDENMVADPAWRHWLGELAKPGGSVAQRKAMPVALDATAYNMPAPLRELNYLRPSGLPLPAGSPMAGQAFEVMVRSLLKQLTEAMCRVLLPRARKGESGAGAEARGAAGQAPTDVPLDDESLPKVTIFLSHAKRDGTTPARRLRDYIYGQTQLAAFYDENDIAFGSAFSRAIQRDLAAPETLALVAVRSALYAARPWCRRELSLFRTPQRESEKGGLERWRMYPSLVVEALESGQQSPGVAEFGNSPVIRWSDEGPGLEELIVTTLIRDAMLAAFHSALGALIQEKGPASRRKVIVNWLPDPTTLLHIPAVRSLDPLDVVHPGRGLSGLELDILGDYFPHVTFHSFEESLS